MEISVAQAGVLALLTLVFGLGVGLALASVLLAPKQTVTPPDGPPVDKLEPAQEVPVAPI